DSTAARSLLELDGGRCVAKLRPGEGTSPHRATLHAVGGYGPRHGRGSTTRKWRFGNHHSRSGTDSSLWRHVRLLEAVRGSIPPTGRHPARGLSSTTG